MIEQTTRYGMSTRVPLDHHETRGAHDRETHRDRELRMEARYIDEDRHRQDRASAPP